MKKITPCLYRGPVDFGDSTNILGRACFFRMAPSKAQSGGERGERLTNTLFAQAQRRIVRRKLVSVDVRFR